MASDHPFGPAVDHHVKTQALVEVIRKRTAREMVKDLSGCTQTDACLSVLHYRRCPVHS